MEKIDYELVSSRYFNYESNLLFYLHRLSKFRKKEALMTSNELFEKLEKVRLQQNADIATFYKALGIGQSTFYAWRKGALPKSVEVALNIINFIQGE